MPIFSRERGGAKFTALLILVFLAAVVHIAFTVAPLHIAEASLKDQMSEQAALAQTIKDEDIMRNIMSKARELGIPLKPGDIHLVRNDEMRSMQISAQWDVTVHFFCDFFPFYTTRVFHFAPVVKERYVIKL